MRTDTSAQVVSSFSDSDDYITTMSSKHMWDTFVHLLFQTLKPLAQSTTIVDDILFVILGSLSDQRRKIGVMDNQQCLNEAYRLLFQPSDVALRESMIRLGVERGIYQWFITSYLSNTYVPLSIHIEPSFEAEPLYTYVQEMFSLYTSFRERVIDRFERLIKSKATKDKWSRDRMGLVSSVGDVENTYYLAVIRSIDKFHPGEGTITGYVKPWLQNAGSSKYTMYTGEAFGLSRPIRKDIHDGKLSVNNKAYDITLAESLPDEVTVHESSEGLHEMFQAMRKSPYVSFIMTLYGFPTCLTFTESQWLKDHNVGDEFQSLQAIEDLPTLMPLSRASRRQTEASDKRKHLIVASTKKRKTK